MTHPDLAYALGDDVSADVETYEGDELRELRARLENVENQMSYVRRVAQTRIDLARSEMAQRTAGRNSSELSDVIRRLPDVLAENAVASGMPRFADPEIDPDPVYSLDLDSVVPPMKMLEIGQLSRRELRDIIVRLESVEARTSVQRRIVQERLDSIHDRIAQAVIGGAGSSTPK